MFMGVLPACRYVHNVQPCAHTYSMQYQQRPEESIRFSGIGVPDDYLLPYRCWGRNPEPLKK